MQTDSAIKMRQPRSSFNESTTNAQRQDHERTASTPKHMGKSPPIAFGKSQNRIGEKPVPGTGVKGK